MIIIADDYILLFTSLAAMLWGLARYLLAPKAPLPGVPEATRLSLAWAVQSIVVDVVGAAVLLVVVRFGTENTISDIVSLSAAALFAASAFLLPRKSYRPGLVRLDRAILILLAVLLLAGAFYDKLAR